MRCIRPGCDFEAEASSAYCLLHRRSGEVVSRLEDLSDDPFDDLYEDDDADDDDQND